MRCPINEASDFLRELELSARERQIAERVLKEIQERLRFLLDVGLDYLSLDRPSGSLSGGEAQRIRLATQIGAGLVGVLYVLDEPSIGLHQRDNQRLIETLVRLKDLGNTLIVVEHDEETIRTADWVVDIGPGAGEHGGQVVHSGDVAGLLDHADSLTGHYLSGRREIPVPEVRRPRTKGRDLVVHGAREHNLQELTVGFPLGLFVAVTGVSGSGKSTLVNDILYTSLAKQIYNARAVPGRHTKITGVDHVDKVIHVDQSPIGRTPRSNPATYTGVFDHVRKLFASTPEAKMRGYLQGRFSFNVKGGRCEACAGDGTIKIEMNFLPDVYVPCEVCHGARYNRETLEVHYKGKTIAEVLDMPIEEAAEFFAAVPAISRHMKTLCEVGLGYVRLGQPATTLSGGEAQRVKLASELQKRSTGRTVYVLDEPTTGLHFEDIRKLLLVLGRLVDQGNTVLVIEHNLDVIKTADWIVDMGPEGGSRWRARRRGGHARAGRRRPRQPHRAVPRAVACRWSRHLVAPHARTHVGDEGARQEGCDEDHRQAGRREDGGQAGHDGGLGTPVLGPLGNAGGFGRLARVASRHRHPVPHREESPVTDDRPETDGPATADPTRSGVGRRTMLTGVAAAGVGIPLLAACGSGSDDTVSGTDTSPAAGDSSPAEVDSGGGGDTLAGTADVAVGGAVFLDEPSVVITQPTEGDFKAFNRACTHQGCPVVDLVDGNIHCNCHGSMFSATDGSVVQGPATQPLAAVDITVDGDQILPA